MKKTLKILGIYILFGIVMIGVSLATGGIEYFFTMVSYGAITTPLFIKISILFVLFWLPFFVMTLISGMDVINLPYSNYVIIFILVIFLIISISLIKKEKK